MRVITYVCRDAEVGNIVSKLSLLPLLIWGIKIEEQSSFATEAGTRILKRIELQISTERRVVECLEVQ